MKASNKRLRTRHYYHFRQQLFLYNTAAYLPLSLRFILSSAKRRAVMPIERRYTPYHSLPVYQGEQ